MRSFHSHGLSQLAHTAADLPQLVLENFTFRDRLRVIDTEQPLGPFPVGLCADKQRLEGPLVSAFWSAARRSYPGAK